MNANHENLRRHANRRPIRAPMNETVCKAKVRRDIGARLDDKSLS